jgi:hypothetical protein
VPVEAYAKELLESFLMAPISEKRNGHATEPESAVEPFPVLDGYVPALSKDELYQVVRSPIFFDAGMFIGALLRDDPRHPEARPIVKALWGASCLHLDGYSERSLRSSHE